MDRGHDPTTAVGGVIPAPPGSQATAEAHAALSPAGPRVPPCQCVDAVEDEYGERFTPDEFVALVGQTVLEARRRQYDWMAAHDPIRVSAGPEIGMTWLDPDGFTFTARGFS